MQAVKGVWAATITPFNADMTVDVGALEAHVDWLLESGCNGVALLATAGEANSIGINERLALVQEIEGNWDPDRIMIGVGTTAVPDTAAMIRTAVDHDYPNVLMLPPFFYPDVSDEGLFQFLVEVARRLGRNRPFIHLHDFPAMVGFGLGAGLQARMNDAYPELVVGAVDSSGDFDRMSGVVQRVPGFRVYAGTEELLLPLWLKGGAGCLSATCNVTAPAAKRVWDAIENGDVAEAEKAQAALTAQRLAIQNWPLVPAVKAILRRRFPDRVSRVIRPPLLSLSDLDRERLFTALDEIGNPL